VHRNTAIWPAFAFTREPRVSPQPLWVRHSVLIPQTTTRTQHRPNRFSESTTAECAPTGACKIHVANHFAPKCMSARILAGFDADF
jgi:hypothetical protein